LLTNTIGVGLTLGGLVKVLPSLTKTTGVGTSFGPSVKILPSLVTMTGSAFAFGVCVKTWPSLVTTTGIGLPSEATGAGVGVSTKVWPLLTTTTGVGVVFESVTGSARLSANVATPTAVSVAARGVLVPGGPPSGVTRLVGSWTGFTAMLEGAADPGVFGSDGGSFTPPKTGGEVGWDAGFDGGLPTVDGWEGGVGGEGGSVVVEPSPVESHPPPTIEVVMGMPLLLGGLAFPLPRERLPPVAVDVGDGLVELVGLGDGVNAENNSGLERIGMTRTLW
jgi:hypothetical protein